MTKIFLDTNVWLRLFLEDTDQAKSVKILFSSIEEGKFLPYTSSIVYLEIAFVLEKVYKQSREKITDYLQAISNTRNITIIDKTNNKIALNYFQKTGVKFSDCLIASQIAKNMTLVTFDEDFKKFSNLKIAVPSYLN